MTTAVRIPYDIFDRDDTLSSYILTFYMPPLNVGTTPPLSVKAFDATVLDPALWPELTYGSEWTVRQNSNTLEVVILNPTNYDPWDKLLIQATEAYERPVDAPVNYNKYSTDTEGDYDTRLIQQIDGRISYLEKHVWQLIGMIRPPNEKGRIIMIDDDTGHAIFRGCNLLQEPDGTVSAGTPFNVFADFFAENAVVDEDLHVGGVLTVAASISAGGTISSNANFSAGTNLTVGANATVGNNLSVTGSINANDNLTVTKDTVTGTLTVVGSANLNTIFANSAVITVIESNNIISDRGTITNLETVGLISGSINTNTLTVNTSFTIPTACVFNVDGGSFGWFLNPTTNNRANLVLGIHNNKVVITNEEFPEIPNVTVDPDYIPKGGPNGELINSNITDDGTTVSIPDISISTALELGPDAVMQVKNAEFGFNIDIADTTKTNLVLGLDNGQLVITNDVMPTGGGGTGDIIVPLNTIAKGSLNNALRASNITDDGTTVTIGIRTEIGGGLSCTDLNTSSIADDGTQVAISKPLSIAGNATATGSMIAPNVDVTTFLNMGYTSQMVTNGAVFLFDFVGDFETKPYVRFLRGTEGQLKLTNTALPAVDVSTKYDSSGILSGFKATYGVDTLTISEGTCVVWDGTAYEEVTTSAPIIFNPPLDVPSYVLLRWNGLGSVEAYAQTSRPSNALKVHDAWLYYITVFNNTIDEVSNHFRNLNQQLEQVIDVIGLMVPYSTIGIALGYGDTSLVRGGGRFTEFGIRDIPTTADKYNTSHIDLVEDNNPFFDLMDVDGSNESSYANSFPLPAEWSNAGVLEPIPADSWGYFLVLVTVHGRLKFIYPSQVFVSESTSSEDAQDSIRDLELIHDFRDDGYAVIGILGLKGGLTTFELDTSQYYKHVYQLGGGSNVVSGILPDANNYDLGDRLTVIEPAPGTKEWAGRADSVKSSTVGYEAYYDSTTTISGRETRIKTSTPGYYAVYDSSGLALEGSTGPTFNSPVKDGTIGKPAYYDTVSTVSSSTGHIVPNPTVGDTGKILSATAADTIGWVDAPSSPTSPVKISTIGQLAAYDTTTTVQGISDKAVPNPTAGDVGKLLSATAEDTIEWIEAAEIPTSPVKTSTMGQVALYDTTTTVLGTNDKLAPNPTAGDIDKVLGATAEGVVGWVDQASGGSGTISPGVAGRPAVYNAETTITSSTNLLVTTPTGANTGQIYTALSAGAAGWRGLDSAVDSIVVTKVISDSQQAGDILTTLSKRRLYSTGRRLYDDFSRREILALDGQTIQLRQYPGLGLKADIVDNAPDPDTEIPPPIQGTGVSWSGYRQIRFWHTNTNANYVLEITASAYDSTSGLEIHLGTIDKKTGVITRIRTHTTWAASGTISYPYMCGQFFVVDPTNNYYAFTIYTATTGYYHAYFYNLADGTPVTFDTTDRWGGTYTPGYGIWNGHLYVFYRASNQTPIMDKLLIQAGPTGAPTWQYVINARSIGSGSVTVNYRIKQIDLDTLFVFWNRYTTSYYFYSIKWNLSTDTATTMTIYDGYYGNYYATAHGFVYYQNEVYFAYAGNNINASLSRGEISTVDDGITVVNNIMPGTASVGWSYYDQHPKYTNVCVALKNDKRQLFISYDYTETWVEVAGFAAATNFWPTNPPTGSGGASLMTHQSRSIWLDDNSVSMIFTGWLLNGGTDAPLAIQPLGAGPREANLPTWQEGAYLISTEYQYLPVTWFDDTFSGLVIGETYHKRGLPLARAVTDAGEVSSINWASGTTPPAALNGFACSTTDLSAWAISNRNVYLASDGYSFADVYLMPLEQQTIEHLAYFDETRCLVTTTQTDPSGNSTVALVSKDGNVNVIYNAASAYPSFNDVAVTDNYIVLARTGVPGGLWADRGDLIFTTHSLGAEIKKITSVGLTTYGIGVDGLSLYMWDGKGNNETLWRTFDPGTVITDIAAVTGKLYVIGNVAGSGCAYVHDGVDWTDHLSITTDNEFNALEVSPTSINDVIIGCEIGFYASSDGFLTEPTPISVGSGVEPTDVQQIAVDLTNDFTVFFGIDGAGQGFNYRGGDVETSIITDLMEDSFSGALIGMAPMGYMVRKKATDDFWTRKMLMLTPTSTYSQRQTIAEGANGAIYIQDDAGVIGVSLDAGDTFNNAPASPVGESGRGGAFVGGLSGNGSLIALSGGRMLRSTDDWVTSVATQPFANDQHCTCFSRDLSRKDIVYAAASQQGTGLNICRVVRFSVVDGWGSPSTLLDVTLDGGLYFTYVAAYNDRIVVAQSDGVLRYSTDSGLTWSAPHTGLTPSTGITSLWIENTTDCIYVAKDGGVFYNSFTGIENDEDWIVEDVPVSADQPVGAHIIDRRRTVGIMGNIGANLYWRRYDT